MAAEPLEARLARAVGELKGFTLDQWNALVFVHSASYCAAEHAARKAAVAAFEDTPREAALNAAFASLFAETMGTRVPVAFDTRHEVEALTLLAVVARDLIDPEQAALLGRPMQFASTLPAWWAQAAERYYFLDLVPALGVPAAAEMVRSMGSAGCAAAPRSWESRLSAALNQVEALTPAQVRAWERTRAAASTTLTEQARRHSADYAMSIGGPAARAAVTEACWLRDTAAPIEAVATTCLAAVAQPVMTVSEYDEITAPLRFAQSLPEWWHQRDERAFFLELAPQMGVEDAADCVSRTQPPARVPPTCPPPDALPATPAAPSPRVAAVLARLGERLRVVSGGAARGR